MVNGPVIFQPSNLNPLDVLQIVLGMDSESADDSSRAFSFWNMLILIPPLLMVVGGVIPYVPQYLEIKKTNNADGFSLYVCLTLLGANILRILYWFGSHYELPLFVQSIVMNLAMLAIVQLCVQVKQQNQIVKGKERLFTDGKGKFSVMQLDFDQRYFWKWTDFRSYLEFTAAFTLVAGFVTYCFLDYSLFVEVLGFSSTLLEAMLGIPQFYDNFVSKSTYGMSRKMVLLWLVGDACKTFYFVFRSTPLQFVVCGFLQIGIDLAILSQIVWYGTSPGRRKRSDVLK